MSILSKIKKIGKKITNKVEDLEISEKVDSYKDKATDVVESATKTIKDLDEKYDISEKLEKAKDSVVETAGDLKDKASDVVDDISEKIEAKWNDKIVFEDFEKVELKLGKILEAEEIKKSKKLYKLKVDFGEEEPRQILSGIKEFYEIDELVGKKVLFVTNLLPRKIMGLESNGMILGLHDKDEFSLLVADKKSISEGTQAG